jgi:glycosyltransferase involved in cell wall biosynthesis
VKISICIPTYNRAEHLQNCLASIAASLSFADADVRRGIEVCVSDNGSADDTAKVIRGAEKFLPLRHSRNPFNLGISRNFINVVAMARGDFVWLLGDDDLLMPHALQSLSHAIDVHPNVDFFYINSFHLSTQHVLSYPQPFDTKNLPGGMAPFSSCARNVELKFFDLIDPRISFDFLGGMFLAVFRRGAWLQNVGVLDATAISDPRVFSHFDNTFPHVKIFAAAFARSCAYFHADPLSVCLTGAREWAPMYPLVKSVRLVEALEEYRRQGLPLGRYLRCRNFALANFLPDLVSMYVRRPQSGFAYLRPLRLILANCVYPNFYLSLLTFSVRKTGILLRRLVLGVPRK